MHSYVKPGTATLTSRVDESAALPQRLPSERRRRQIVGEATRLIATSGFNSVSLADIARACGISKQSVLRYFPSMKALLTAVLEQRDIDEEQTGDLPTTPEGSKTLLRSIVEANLHRSEIIRLFVVVGVEAQDPSHPAHDYIKRREQLALRFQEDLLAWKPNPRIAARELTAFWHGLEQLWAADPEFEVLEVWDSFAERFFEERASAS